MFCRYCKFLIAVLLLLPACLSHSQQTRIFGGYGTTPNAVVVGQQPPISAYYFLNANPPFQAGATNIGYAVTIERGVSFETAFSQGQSFILKDLKFLGYGKSRADNHYFITDADYAGMKLMISISNENQNALITSRAVINLDLSANATRTLIYLSASGLPYYQWTLNNQIDVTSQIRSFMNSYNGTDKLDISISIGNNEGTGNISDFFNGYAYKVALHNSGK